VIATTGAVWDGTDLVLTDELEVREPGPGEVSVRVLASGICHSDLNVIDGHNPMALPVVPGHEGAGIVDRLGPGVESVSPGDLVVIGSTVPCGTCRFCAEGRSSACRDAFGSGSWPFRWRGQPVRAFANTSSWAATTTVRASQLVPAPGIPATSAALIGCAVSTGYGVVRNVVDVRPGDCVVVFGIGGIGVNVLQTARLSGAASILAVDVNPAKQDAAFRFGAHDVLIADPSTTGRALVELVQARCGAGPLRWLASHRPGPGLRSPWTTCCATDGSWGVSTAPPISAATLPRSSNTCRAAPSSSMRRYQRCGHCAPLRTRWLPCVPARSSGPSSPTTMRSGRSDERRGGSHVHTAGERDLR
jgi:D-arabinose 1-dehydrogenase-like Zn-dependent alcohol dehydrogenase